MNAQRICLFIQTLIFSCYTQATEKNSPKHNASQPLSPKQVNQTLKYQDERFPFQRVIKQGQQTTYCHFALEEKR
jgi:hypothetical protein